MHTYSKSFAVQPLTTVSLMREACSHDEARCWYQINGRTLSLECSQGYKTTPVQTHFYLVGLQNARPLLMKHKAGSTHRNREEACASAYARPTNLRSITFTRGRSAKRLKTHGPALANRTLLARFTD